MPEDRVEELRAKTIELGDLRIQQLKDKLFEVGICPECLDMITHAMDEPFSNCSCGTGEWTAPPPMLFKLRYDMARACEKVTALQNLCDRLKLEAQIHSGEARTQKSTVHEVYQAVGSNAGDWNGAMPVIEKMQAIQLQIDNVSVLLEKAVTGVYELMNKQHIPANIPDVLEAIAGGINKAMNDLKGDVMITGVDHDHHL